MLHCFNPIFAEMLGVTPALVLQHILYWINDNKKHGRNRMELELNYDYMNLHGEYRTFIYSSIATMHAQRFNYLTERQINYAISKLCKAGILIKANYNGDPRDRTLWYALRDEDEMLAMFTESIKPDKIYKPKEVEINDESEPLVEQALSEARRCANEQQEVKLSSIDYAAQLEQWTKDNRHQWLAYYEKVKRKGFTEADCIELFTEFASVSIEYHEVSFTRDPIDYSFRRGAWLRFMSKDFRKPKSKEAKQHQFTPPVRGTTIFSGESTATVRQILQRVRRGELSRNLLQSYPTQLAKIADEDGVTVEMLMDSYYYEKESNTTRSEARM